jgi:hypothetical protein
MDTNNGVVVFLDALGVSNFTIDESKKFIETRDIILKHVAIFWKMWDKDFKKDLKITLPKPEIATFQDSIVICWSKPKKNSLNILLAAGQWLNGMVNYAIGQRIFFRGAISVGDYIFYHSSSNVTVIGPAVSDAYQFQGIADWIGVIQTDKCQEAYCSFIKADAKERGLKFNPHFYDYLFVKYPVPTREGRDERYVLSWPQLTCQIEHEYPGKPLISPFLLEQSLSTHPDYKSKYNNSLLFLKWYEKEIYPTMPKSSKKQS